MTPTMKTEEVRKAIKARGTKIATVVFIKKNGELRKVNGLFRTTKHMVGGDRGEQQHETLRNNDLVAIYSLADKGWRSFKAGAVVEIK